MKPRYKSRTHYFGLAVIVLGVVQANYPLIQASLGDKAGWVYIGIGIIISVLREITKEPVR